jgi:hypothetical protein
MVFYFLYVILLLMLTKRLLLSHYRNNMLLLSHYRNNMLLLSHYRNNMFTARPKFLVLQTFSSASLSVICGIYDLNLHINLMLLHGPAYFVLFVKYIVINTLS